MNERHAVVVFDGAGTWRALALGALVAGLLVTTGCSTRRVSQPAPVEDRSGAKVAEVKPPPATDNLVKPGYYTVRPGDTLYRIALEAGQAPHDLQAWNNLSNPDLIEVGQVLRVMPPPLVSSAAGPSVPSATGSAAVTAPAVMARSLNPLPAPVSAPAPAVTPSAPAANGPAASPAPDPVSGGDEIGFVWPAQGSVLAPFDESKNKGVAIVGNLGDPVVAAADGRVVYAGAGLRGYGNLIILKHNNTYLTAYAHNQTLLVREDQAVKQGQRIAEMGSSDADRVKLHFEVRRQGKPVDPLSYLPRR